MPKIEFDSGFKRKGNYDYPKLTLDQSEKARICVIDSPTMEYVHTLRKVITEGGKPIMKTESYGRNQDRKREVPETDFVGKFVCHGDIDTLTNKGVDPDNCPACQASVENGAAVEGPRRRFVVHVIKYLTNKGTFTLQTPFQIEILAWEFAEARYTSLVDIKEEHGNLPGIDLCLGPCINKGYQKYDIIPGGSCQWGADEDRKTKTREVFTANRSDDLSPLLGRKVSNPELRSQVVEVIQAYNYAFGRPESMPATANTNIDNDLSGLIDDGPTTPPNNGKTDIDADPWATGTSNTARDNGSQENSQQNQTSTATTSNRDQEEIPDLESLLSDL